MTIRELYTKILDTYPQYTDYVDVSSGDIEFYLSPTSEYHYDYECFCCIQYYTNDSYTMWLCSLTENDFKNPNQLEYKRHKEVMDNLSPEEILKIIPEFLPRYEAAIEWFEKIESQSHELSAYLLSLGFKGNGYKNNHTSYILDIGADKPFVRMEIPDLQNLGYHVEVCDPQFNKLLSYSNRDFYKCIQKVIE